jgi:hypothetical protein
MQSELSSQRDTFLLARLLRRPAEVSLKKRLPKGEANPEENGTKGR